MTIRRSCVTFNVSWSCNAVTVLSQPYDFLVLSPSDGLVTSSLVSLSAVHQGAEKINHARQRLCAESGRTVSLGGTEILRGNSSPRIPVPGGGPKSCYTGIITEQPQGASASGQVRGC